MKLSVGALTAVLATLWTAPAFAQKGPPDESKVAAAIKKGVKFLKSQGNFKDDNERTSERELVLLTLRHAGVGENDPFFAKHFQIMLKQTPKYTYRTALRAMVLEEVERVRYQPEIYQCAEFLVDNQNKQGFWSYGKPTQHTPLPPNRAVATGPKRPAGGVLVFDTGGSTNKPKPKVRVRLPVEQKRVLGGGGDNSNSQYASLGLRACHDAGIIIPREVIVNAIKWWRECQEKSAGNDVATGGTGRPRGWDYKNGSKGYGSMTAGAVGAMAIYLHMAGQDWKRDRAAIDGAAWLAANFTVTTNPKKNGHHYYYLYGLERAGMLFDTETFGKNNWYNEGAHYLLSKQGGDGKWGSRKDTCFAILFLRRATRALVESVDKGRR